MRIWGRVTNPDGSKTWIQVQSQNGNHDAVMVTALAQALKLNLGESPFYANYGLPQYQSIQTQVPPHYWVMKMQQAYSGFFASLAIIPQSGNSPTYLVRAVLHNGTVINAEIPV